MTTIPTPEELDILNDTTDPVAAVHAQLEDLTPPEALEVLKEVAANLRAEVRDFNTDRDRTSKRADGSP